MILGLRDDAFFKMNTWCGIEWENGSE